ncbi:MAG: relaxase/mobilization nuclease domain-containing protein [Acidimicrobiales bacterium]
MIAKISRGDDISGLVRYLMGPGRENEHTNQRVVASCDTVDVRCGVRLDREEVATLGRRLDAPRADFDRVVTGGHVWHLSLSNRADDRPLSDQQWAEIARGAMEAMGFTEASGKPPCRWVAVAHGPSAEGHEHIHLAVSLVREDGTVASNWRDRVKLSRYCAEVERRYGLISVHQPGCGLPGVTRAEQERARREGRTEPDRTRLSRVVRAAAVAAESEAEFVRRLRRSGVLPRPRYAEGGRDRVVGYSVALTPGRGGKPVWFGGGKLAADLTLPRLREFWESSPAEIAAAVAEWRGTARTPAHARERVVAGPRRWQVAASAVEDTYRRLMTPPLDDPALWAGTAREAAGVLAAWSLRLEADRPGPLGRAADALARSAQTPRAGPRASRAAVPALRGVAGIVIQALLAKDSTEGWVALLGQLTLLARTIARVHGAQGDRWQAERLATLAVDDLRHLQDRFREVAIGDLVPNETIGATAGRPSTRPLVRPTEQAETAHRRQLAHDDGLER